MDDSYQIAIVDSDAGFAELRLQWQEIERADPEATPFNTHDWLSLWWKYYQHPDMELHVVQFIQADKLVAIAPMYLRTKLRLKVIKQRELRWLGSGGDTSPDYLNVVCLPEHRQQVVKSFADYLVQFDSAERISLSDMSNPSALYSQLQSTLSAQKGQLFSSVTNSIFHSDLPGTWDEYRLALSRKRRKAINHRRNRLDQAGDWSLHVCDTEEQRHAAVRALEDLHRQRWVTKGAPGGFETGSYVDFHRDVIETFSASDQLWLVVLTLNDEIIGVLYLFEWRSSLLFFQSGFSPDHESLSPGHVMFTYVMGEAIERGIEHIDLLKGDYNYKKAYAKDVRETSDLVYERPGILGVASRSKRLVNTYRPKPKKTSYVN